MMFSSAVSTEGLLLLIVFTGWKVLTSNLLSLYWLATLEDGYHIIDCSCFLEKKKRLN